MKPAAFIDRDGVLNRAVMRDGQWVSPRTLAEFQLFNGLSQAASILRDAGHLVFVVTNQPDVARGLMSYDDLSSMSAQVMDALRPDEIWTCVHDDADNCTCRKPRPGALIQLARRWNADLSRSVIIGDTQKDVGAGRAAGIPAIIVDRDYNQSVSADFRVSDIGQAAELAVHIAQRKEMRSMDHINEFFKHATEIIERLHRGHCEQMVQLLFDIRARGGRVFFIGSGGGAGHASHAVNDFRKIAGIECYSPTDNVSELTARINDDGWDTSYANWLKVSRIGPKDAVFVFSVGGGNAAKNISMNLVRAMQLAKEVGAAVLGIVGRDGGYAAEVGDAVLVIPNLGDVTAQVESFQAVVWHMLVSHPRLLANQMKWESVDAGAKS